ncbi:sugar transferase [Synechococcus sp. CS-1328]|uniref:sugar transferase n=1 Tax=Synechococcus sp. CS-1328 TaxID=2847976 RepID=UPI00223BF6A2|nr:sugar transferase [Synechococcus sp. CS-1328]MCT0224968.1 sugar transferase [Synechococcus sp. CS-1328]
MSGLPWRRPRHLLALCAGLDLAACLVLAAAIDALRGTDLLAQPGWLVAFGLVYLLFGWLLGTYTVLRWPWLRLRLVILRLAITALATMLLVALVDWFLNLPAGLFLSHRSTQVYLLGSLSVWALLVRLALRWVGRRYPQRDWGLMAAPHETPSILREWQRTPFAVTPRVLPLSGHAVSPGGVVLGSDLRLAPDQERQLRALGEGGVPITTVIELAERELERLPPALLPGDWLSQADIPWSDTFSVQRQLKRAADVVVALLLLLLALPVMLLAGLLIWLEDRGPVFYVQARSGWMGKTFRLLKLRTMTDADADAPASWTVPGDGRITRVGQVLRRVRLDELPQLVNVLSGDMSLIGPRPERPEHEADLEAHIPHYRKRHWMRPGLSGWAQVSAPYAASLEEAELKLSYDLYYLHNWSTALDLLILFKTIKIVLKAGGR